MLSKSGLFVACLVTLAVQQIVSSPVVRVKRNDDLNDHLDPINQVEDSGQGLEREKRKLPDAVFGTKNALLGLVFSGSSAPKKIGKGIGDGDVAQLDRNKVALDIPSELFANSFNTVTNLSKIAGNFIMNSARRFSVFVDLFRPLLGKALVVKGIPLPPPNSTLVITNNV